VKEKIHKHRKPGYKRRPQATSRKVQIGDCDSDDNIRVKDDQTLSGKISVTKCGCERRYRNNATRLAAVSKTVADRLRVYFQKLYNTNINYPVVVKMLKGNHKQTIFGYTVKVPSSDQTKVRNALKQACKDDEVSCWWINNGEDEIRASLTVQVKKVIEQESIKRPGDGDSSSSSSSSEEAKPVSRKATAKQAETVAPRTTHKASRGPTKKAGKAVKFDAIHADA
jgi:hypothetical protein